MEYARFVLWTGGASLRIGPRFLCLRPPWNRPSFSEREGVHHMLLRLAGWRLFWRALDRP